jgi:hypothetical protein
MLYLFRECVWHLFHRSLIIIIFIIITIIIVTIVFIFALSHSLCLAGMQLGDLRVKERKHTGRRAARKKQAWVKR